MLWHGRVLKVLSSHAPVTTGDEDPGDRTGTGEVVATMSTLAGCLHESLWTPARGAGTCDTSSTYTIMRQGEL